MHMLFVFSSIIPEHKLLSPEEMALLYNIVSLQSLSDFNPAHNPLSWLFKARFSFSLSTHSSLSSVLTSSSHPLTSPAAEAWLTKAVLHLSAQISSFLHPS